MKRPAIQLYFGDWLRNAKLRRCSWGARGVLIEVMALMHDSDEYGALRWPLAEIAQAVGCPPALIRELATKGVLKGSDKAVHAYRWAPSHAGQRGPEVVLVPEQDGPLWYSSRMVRDEYKRTNRGIGTRFGPGGKLSTAPPSASPSTANGDANGTPSPSPSAREGDGASSSASSSSIGFTGSQQKRVRATDGETATAGDKNRPENQGQNGHARPPAGWRTVADAAARYAGQIGLNTIRGESTAELVSRIDRHLGRS